MESADLFRESLRAILRSKPRGNQGGLAEAVNVGRKHLNDFLGGRKPLSESKREEIAKYLGYNYEDFLRIGRKLVSGQLNSFSDSEIPECENQFNLLVSSEDQKELFQQQGHDYLGIPLYESGRLAADPTGYTFDPQEEPESTVVIYRPELKGRRYHNLRALRVGGDSMWPVIPKGSIVVADLSDREFVDRRIYVVNYDETENGMPVAGVKRIRQGKQGFVLVSENREYLPEITSLDWRDLVVGRVVWMWRSLEEETK